MGTFVAKITVMCFAASYGVALVMEILLLLRPRPIYRWIAFGFGAAGILAHALYLGWQAIPLKSPSGSLLLLAFILAVFYLYGSLHHRGFAWGTFVLPIVLVLVLLALPGSASFSDDRGSILGQLLTHDFWPAGTHAVLFLLSGVGVCVGFIASLMYFVQLYRLRKKVMPTSGGVRFMSLERLEAMNRRAILWAFPFLTVGLLVSIFTQLQYGSMQGAKLWSTLALWVVFAILLYLRYAAHVRGRSAALWTIFAFALMLLSFLFSHGETT
jgi:ABC-type transport system involved in cytochrome c biogenesis permease subunit